MNFLVEEATKTRIYEENTQDARVKISQKSAIPDFAW